MLDAERLDPLENSTTPRQSFIRKANKDCLDPLENSTTPRLKGLSSSFA